MSRRIYRVMIVPDELPCEPRLYSRYMTRPAAYGRVERLEEKGLTAYVEQSEPVRWPGDAK